MTISQLFILSPRGDKIISKEYRHDMVRGTDEIFFRKFKFWDGPSAGDTPPFFTVDGINYSFVKKNNLLLVVTTRQNLSPSALSEFLIRLTKLLKDFLGVLNEESLRKNFVLVYEILDEVIDFGYLQGTSTEKLVPYIANDPVPVDQDDATKKAALGSISKPSLARITGKGTKLKGAADAQKTILGSEKGSRKNEIYVDVLERLNVVFNSSGNVVTAEIDGAIIMKSFLAGTPELRLGLNEDLSVGGNDRFGGVNLESANFHECVNYSDFNNDRTLFFRPPDGEFVVMNYRVTHMDYHMPFTIIPFIEQVTPFRIELTLKVKSHFPAAVHASTVLVKFAVPKLTTSVSVELRGGAANQNYEYKAADKMVVWLIKKFNGDTEHMCKAKISFNQAVADKVRREIGPISMNFEIPMYIVSGLSIRFLRIEERSKSYNPSRWVRNITQANSYICRLN